jgi:hypothetical protein
MDLLYNATFIVTTAPTAVTIYCLLQECLLSVDCNLMLWDAKRSVFYDAHWGSRWMGRDTQAG